MLAKGCNPFVVEAKLGLPSLATDVQHRCDRLRDLYPGDEVGCCRRISKMLAQVEYFSRLRGAACEPP